MVHWAEARRRAQRMRLQGVTTVVMPTGRSGPTGSAQEQPQAELWKENLVDGHAWWREASCRPSWPLTPLDARGSLQICQQAPRPPPPPGQAVTQWVSTFLPPSPSTLTHPPEGQPVLPNSAAIPLSPLKTTRGHPLS